jgi:malonyl CoA-acyl carrier protein transacylase
LHNAFAISQNDRFRARLREAAAERRRKDSELPTKSSEAISSVFGETQDLLAKEAKTTRYKAGQALDVAEEAADIIDDVIAGKVPLRKAAKVAKARKPSKRKPAARR